MNIKELKRLIANMPDDAPVLLSDTDNNYKEAWHMDSLAIYRSEERLYEDFVAAWQLHEPATEKVVALCLC